MKELCSEVMVKELRSEVMVKELCSEVMVKEVCSEVMVSFTYCDIHQCYCSNHPLDSRMTRPPVGLKMANDG